MRLAIVSQQGARASGAEFALLDLVRRLPDSVELSWFFFEDGEFARAIRTEWPSVTIVKMSDRVARAQRGGLPFAAIFDSFSVTARLARALSATRPDLVITNSMKAHIIGSLAAKLARLRCVNYVHDIVDGPARVLLRAVSQVCAVERLTCSNLVKSQVALPNTTVVYAAIDVAEFADLPDRSVARRQLGLPEGDVPIVALVGRIARWKGQDRFLRIAASVVERHAAHFCIVGSPIFGCDAEYVESLAADVSRLGLERYVTFVPWQKSMTHVYAAIDIACNCSTREPFGRTSLEALASGVPIICFDDAGVCEVFEQDQGGMHVGAGDEVAFADATLRYLQNPQKRSDVAARARHSARKVDIHGAYAVFATAIERAAQRKIDTGTAPADSMAASPVFIAVHDKRQEDECLAS